MGVWETKKVQKKCRKSACMKSKHKIATFKKSKNRAKKRAKKKQTNKQKRAFFWRQIGHASFLHFFCTFFALFFALVFALFLLFFCTFLHFFRIFFALFPFFLCDLFPSLRFLFKKNCLPSYVLASS